MPRFDKLLVLDLDETLIHAVDHSLGRDPDFIVGEFLVYKRPYVGDFLATCLNWFETGVWTSASPDYALEVVRHLFGSPETLSFVWTRERCTWSYDPSTGQHRFVKDLKKLKKQGYKLEHIIVIEDSVDAIARNYGNAVLVSAYSGQEDAELKHVLPLLERLGDAQNVRTSPKRRH